LVGLPDDRCPCAHWGVVTEGQITFRWADLRRPGLPVAAIDLVTGGSGTVEQPAPGPILDPSALESYRQRLRHLDADIAEADDWCDPARREAMEAERDALVEAHGGDRTRGKGTSRRLQP
jgi:hypothetical protein